MQKAFQEEVQGLQAWLRSNSCLAIAEVLGWYVEARGGRQCTGGDVLPCLVAAVEEQDQIGWDWTLQGKLSLLWQQLQHQWLQEVGSQKSAERWVADLSSYLLALTHTLWTTHSGIIHEHDEDGLLMEEGHQLHQAIEEQFSLGEQELNIQGHHLLEVRRSRILAMWATDRKKWLQAVTLE